MEAIVTGAPNKVGKDNISLALAKNSAHCFMCARVVLFSVPSIKYPRNPYFPNTCNYISNPHLPASHTASILRNQFDEIPLLIFISCLALSKHYIHTKPHASHYSNLGRSRITSICHNRKQIEINE